MAIDLLLLLLLLLLSLPLLVSRLLSSTRCGSVFNSRSSRYLVQISPVTRVISGHGRYRERKVSGTVESTVLLRLHFPRKRDGKSVGKWGNKRGRRNRRREEKWKGDGYLGEVKRTTTSA